MQCVLGPPADMTCYPTLNVSCSILSMEMLVASVATTTASTVL